MTREIVLDTETTGIDPKDGHRIIEIGALEMDNHMPTGKQLHLYINPERDIDAGAVAIHGLTSEFLADKPVFADIVDEFLNFVGDSPMVIHNAPFDMGFVNAELARPARAPLARTQGECKAAPLPRPRTPPAPRSTGPPPVRACPGRTAPYRPGSRTTPPLRPWPRAPCRGRADLGGPEPRGEVRVDGPLEREDAAAQGLAQADGRTSRSGGASPRRPHRPGAPAVPRRPQVRARGVRQVVAQGLGIPDEEQIECATHAV